MIACVTIPYFAAAVERRNDRCLGKIPLVIGGRAWEPRPLYAYSREARRRGIRPGMLLRQAQVVAPSSQFLPADGDSYRQAAGEAGGVLLDFTCFVEPEAAWHPPADRGQPLATPDLSLPARYYLDWESLPVGETLALTRHLGQTLRRETALEAAVGLAESRFAAQLAAAAARPGYIRSIAPERQSDFLAPYPLNCLPLPAETLRRMNLLGLHTLGQLTALPLPALREQFGAEIVPFYRLARGESGPTIAAQKAELAETAVYRFESPVIHRETLTAVLTHLAQTLANRLQQTAQVGGQLRLIWETERGQDLGQTLSLRQPSADASRLAAGLEELLTQSPPAEGVSAVTVTIAPLMPARAYQLSLFGRTPSLPDALAHLITRLQGKFQGASFLRAACDVPDHPVLEQRVTWRALADDPLLA